MSLLRSYSALLLSGYKHSTPDGVDKFFRTHKLYQQEFMVIFDQADDILFQSRRDEMIIELFKQPFKPRRGDKDFTAMTPHQSMQLATRSAISFQACLPHFGS